MDLLQIMKSRRSVRTYTGAQLPTDKLEQILRAGLLAPGGRNIRPVEFVVVKERETLKKLSESRSAGAGMLADAACAVVVIAAADKVDTWIEDSSLAMGNMLLMAECLNVAACWVQQRGRKTAQGEASGAYVKALLGIPAHYEVESILSLGIAEKKPEPRTWDETEIQKIHREHF